VHSDYRLTACTVAAYSMCNTRADGYSPMIDADLLIDTVCQAVESAMQTKQDVVADAVTQPACLGISATVTSSNHALTPEAT